MRDRFFYGILIVMVAMLVMQGATTFVFTQQANEMRDFATQICNDSNTGREAGNEAREIQKRFMLNAAEAREREAVRHDAAGDRLAAAQNRETAGEYRTDAAQLDTVPLTKCQVG